MKTIKILGMRLEYDKTIKRPIWMKLQGNTAPKYVRL